MLECGEGFGSKRGESLAGARFIETHGAAEEVIGMQAAEGKAHGGRRFQSGTAVS